MAPPKQVSTLLLLIAVSALDLVVSQHQPYFFNYQPQSQFQNYQPFTNAPPPNYYQSSYESGEGGGSDILNNFFGTNPTQGSRPLVTYPTQVTTVSNSPQTSSPSTSSTGAHPHHQPYQPVGNSIVQTQPVQSTLTNNPFRPINPFANHHTHIVNGLPRQQFFGNNYDFFRQRHGLTNLPTTSGPFLHNTLTNPTASGSPGGVRPQSPTPPVLISTSAAPFTAPGPTKTSVAPKSEAPQQARIASPPTTPTIVKDFPTIIRTGPLAYSQAPKSTTPQHPLQTRPVVANINGASQPTTTGVSPAFALQQYYPETGNELPREPLFGEDAEDDDVEPRVRQPQSSSVPNSIFREGNNNSPPLPPVIKPQASLGNTLNTNAKDEPEATRVHSTTPIRIVFNYEQALQAIEENPGVRVVIAHTTERSNETSDEVTQRPIQTTPRPLGTTYTDAYRPQTVPTPVQQTHPTSRFQYQPQYSTDGPSATAQSLENLALELEGRFGPTGRPYVSSPTSGPVHETVATAEPPTTAPLHTYQRGSKKFVIVPRNNENVYKSMEPRVVVNNLASIVVGEFPRSSLSPSLAPQTSPVPSPTLSALPRVTFPQVRYQPDVSQEVDGDADDDLEQEIRNLKQEILTTVGVTTPLSTTTYSTTTTSPPRTRPSSTPRLRATTYRPATTPTFRARTTPEPLQEEEELVVTRESPVEPTAISGRSQPARYYYNDKQRGGLSGAHQRYEYNGIEGSPQEVLPKKPRRKLVRQRVNRPTTTTTSSPLPPPIQVQDAGPIGHQGLPLGSLGPVAFGPPGSVPVQGPPTGPGAGPVFRVGPRGRLLRRKIRPRPQGQAGPSSGPSTEADVSREPPQTLIPSPPTSAIPGFSPISQEYSSEGPGLYSPIPFIPQDPLVTTFRPGPPPNLVVQQSLAVDEEQKEEPPTTTLRTTRFRFSPRPTGPNRPVPSSRPLDDDDEEASNQFESEEEAPAVVPQRRRPQGPTSTTTTERPSAPVIADPSHRANILQRQIRFNKNRKNNQKNT